MGTERDTKFLFGAIRANLSGRNHIHAEYVFFSSDCSIVVCYNLPEQRLNVVKTKFYYITLLPNVGHAKIYVFSI